ncbi:MAG: NfeD family protein [Calditrichaeota bacterium]|nr:NfeD family protein [Calditrichota bacterium]
MEWWHFWVIISLILFILEIFTPGFVLASFGVSGIITTLFAALGVSFRLQLLVFAIATLIVFFTIRPLLKKYFYRFDDPLRTNVQGLIGKTAKVIEAIDNAENQGRVQIGGEDWRARTEGGEKAEVGELVKVVRIEGATAFVEKN